MPVPNTLLIRPARPSDIPARPSDIPALHALIESAYRGPSARVGWTHEADLLDGQRTDPEMLGAIIDDPSQKILLAIDEATPDTPFIGCVHIAKKPHGVAYLGLLTVAPSRQATGLGKLLIAAAEQAAATDFGARLMEMTVIRQRTSLIEFYKRRGYSLTGETRPFPMGDERFGLPKSFDLTFVVLARNIATD